MRLALVSDIHANLEALHATLEVISKEAVDSVVCLGDIVGYNTNPAECIALLRDAGALCVAGNHDRAVTGQLAIEGFGHTAARALVWTRDRLSAEHHAFLAGLPSKRAIGDQLVAVHGALHPDFGCEVLRLDTDERRRLSFAALAAHPSGARICAYGHTHRLGVYEQRGDQIRLLQGDTIHLREDSFYLVNPGTIGEPRGEDYRATFLILDTAQQRITAHRVDYDITPSRKKTRSAGLAPPFSFLPPRIRTPLRQSLGAFGLLGPMRQALRALHR